MLVIAAIFAGGCTSDGPPAQSSAPEAAITTTTAAPATTTTTLAPTPTPTPTPAFQVASPEIAGPVTGPNEPAAPQPVIPLPEGYVLEEFFVGGEATRFEQVGEATPDGFWSAEPAGTADYRTRILVHRPPAERFSGVVLVEWLNETSIGSGGLAWSYIAEEVGRSGHAYVVASVQARDVIGGVNLLESEVEPLDSAPAPGEAEGEAGDSTQSGGLISADPDRYQSLSHPGDAFSYDIHSQIGVALRENGPLVFDGQEPELLVTFGYSQSAAFLSTYLNAVHPLAGVYDAFMIHGRGAGVAPVDGDFVSAATGAASESFITDAVTIRTDLTEPVFLFVTETDLTLMGYLNGRQEDTDMIRTWEVAGTAHVDDTVFRAFLGGPRNPAVGQILGCTEPINVGPHQEAFQAAVAHLITWARDGVAPPTAERLEVSSPPGESPVIVRDELGTAVGGVRNPLLDVPVFVLAGDSAVLTSPEATQETFDVCGLFGTTRALDAETLTALYGSAEQYLQAFDAAATEAVAGGYLLADDAAALRAEAISDFAPLFG